jgi:glucose-6-phosphate isomerase
MVSPDDLKNALTRLEHLDVVGRIWQDDFTVWNAAPTEIVNRLGWLTAPSQAHDQIPAIKSFAQEVKSSGFTHAVLLGMGGSSLAPEVLRQTFGSATGYPELIVLDSILPETVRAVTQVIDPVRTLFIVSSKSGSTVEPNCLCQYFKVLVKKAVGNAKCGQNFIAVTDPGTSLASLGKDDGFRHVFLNSPNLGGRYSVLSYFGLVPAAVMGIDISLLVQNSGFMADQCAYHRSIADNPGAQLGAYMGTMALMGRNKLTLVISPSMAGFGLWVEQLIAESTGKEGKGIIPVVGEPLVSPSCLGADRAFVYLRLEGDDNGSTDETVSQIKSAGYPVFPLDIKDKYDIGGEFFRWEFATAVAGAIMGVHPFNQPDVQRSKEATERILQVHATSGQLPEFPDRESLTDILHAAGKGDYLAIMAYVPQTPEMDDLFSRFRRKVTERYHLATTLGYGPRFLHSTGQLHKGGPKGGIFLQITAAHAKDIAIPGKKFTFGAIADAQALGDLEALQSLGRRVVTAHLKRPTSAALSGLLSI